MAGDHKCPVCQATFTRPQHVARHMRSHTGDRPYKCQHCGDQFARSDLLSRHINKCHASERPPTTTAPNQRRKGNAAASRATTSKQACDQCVQSTLPCDGANPCSKCIQRKYRCTYVKFHRQTAPAGPGHAPPPRPDSEITLGSSLYAPVANAGGARYAQAPPQDDFAYSHPTALAAQPPSATMYGTPYSFNPQLGAYAQQVAPAPEGDALDFASRYRQQAEMLRRAGVIPPPTVHDMNSVHQLNGARGVGVPAYPTTYPGSVWPDDAQRKEVEQFDHYAYLDPARQQYLRQQPTTTQSAQPTYATDVRNDYYNDHTRAGSWGDQHPRRASFAESDGTSSVGTSSVGTSSSAASSNHLPLDLASHPRGGYAPPSHPSIDNGNRPSTASTTSSAQGHSRTASEGGAHDGFSSAFGLMSLDDPAVLAGLASDSQPFFSGMGLATPTPAKERETRDRFGSLFALAGAPATGRDVKEGSKDDSSFATLTPREAETRELREFWKTYMRTPLSGGGPLGGPASIANNNGILGGVVNETPRPSLAGKRGLSRVSSMPSVKTPAREQAPQFQAGSMMPPAQRGTYTSAADDLRSYEAAVLSRRAPMNLNLIPKRARAGSAAVGAYDDNSHASVSVSPPQNTLSIPVRPNTADAFHSSYAYDMARPASSSATSADESSNSSDHERGGGGGRPNFKRLASQTLGPDNAKRQMLYSHDGAPIYDDSALEDDAYHSSDVEHQDIPRMMAAAADRQRRMSAPTSIPPPGQGVLAEAGYA